MKKYLFKDLLLTVMLAILFLIPIQSPASAGWGYSTSGDGDCWAELQNSPSIADGSVILYKYPWSAFSWNFNSRQYKAVPTLNMVNCINDGTNHIQIGSWTTMFATSNSLTANTNIDALALPLSPKWNFYATQQIDNEWFNNIGSSTTSSNWYSMGNSVSDEYIQVKYGSHIITLIPWALRASNSTNYYFLAIMTLLVDGNVANTVMVNNLPNRSMAFYRTSDKIDFVLAGGDSSELYLIVKQPSTTTDTGATKSPVLSGKNHYTQSGNLMSSVQQMATAVYSNDAENGSTPTPQQIPR